MGYIKLDFWRQNRVNEACLRRQENWKRELGTIQTTIRIIKGYSLFVTMVLGISHVFKHIKML